MSGDGPQRQVCEEISSPGPFTEELLLREQNPETCLLISEPHEKGVQKGSKSRVTYSEEVSGMGQRQESETNWRSNCD